MASSTATQKGNRGGFQPSGSTRVSDDRRWEPVPSPGRKVGFQGAARCHGASDSPRNQRNLTWHAAPPLRAMYILQRLRNQRSSSGPCHDRQLCCPRGVLPSQQWIDSKLWIVRMLPDATVSPWIALPTSTGSPDRFRWPAGSSSLSLTTSFMLYRAPCSPALSPRLVWPFYFFSFS